MGSINDCSDAVTRFYEKCFGRFGRFIGTYPKLIISVCMFVTLGLSCGMITLSSETSTEVLYTPVNSQASKDREKYQDTFPDLTGRFFVSSALTSFDKFGEILLLAKDGSVFSTATVDEIRSVITDVKNMNVSYKEEVVTYSDVCGSREGTCYISGEDVMSDHAVASFQAQNMTYPYWNGQLMSQTLGGVQAQGDFLTAASYLKLTFHLRQDSDEYKAKASAWENQFIDSISKLTTSKVTLNYATSQSRDTELNKNTRGDIVYFSITFTLMITYATVIVGGDMVSSRMWIAFAGVLAAGFGILSSFGLISLCGVKFVNIVGVMPFLIIGIGVDDMFLLMSSWAGTYGDTGEIPTKIEKTFRSAGIGITITSLTDLLAFGIGATSVFVSVQNFCIYTGVAVIFCYLYQCLFFGSCLAIHGHRVDDNRHCLTCLRVPTPSKLREEGRSCCTVFWCSGSKPTERESDERCIESIPRKYLPKLLLNRFGCVVVFLVFCGYIGLSSWGIVNFKQGLELKNLVSETSYYHSYEETLESHFTRIVPVPFVFDGALDYTDKNIVDRMETLIDNFKQDNDIDEQSLKCWFHSYRKLPFYDNSTIEKFVVGLRSFISKVPEFLSDVMFDSTNSTITASRCYLFSKDIKDSNRQADLMSRARRIAESSSLSVFVFHPAFIFFEQYVSILPSTLQTLGISLAVMIVVTLLFLPKPLLVLLVTLNIVSILVGIVGSLHIWGLTLSSVTMIHLIMSVGFSVDFSVHVCSAYSIATGSKRERVESSITHAAGPILNGGISSFLGIIVLVFSKSYIFSSFFKVMFTVLLLGILHAVFFLPTVLFIFGSDLIIGPATENCPAQGSQNLSANKDRPKTPPPDYPGSILSTAGQPADCRPHSPSRQTSKNTIYPNPLSS